MTFRPSRLPASLDVGAHVTGAPGACWMEAIAVATGEPRSAFPECVCSTLVWVGQGVNDSLPDGDRDTLLSYSPLVADTDEDGLALERVLIIRKWLATALTYVPPHRRLRRPLAYAGFRDTVLSLLATADEDELWAAGPLVGNALDWIADEDRPRLAFELLDELLLQPAGPPSPVQPDGRDAVSSTAPEPSLVSA